MSNILAADVANISWANTVAGTTAATLDITILAASGMSIEFLAGLSVMQVDVNYKTVVATNWVYTSTTPFGLFWGRLSNSLIATVPTTLDDYNNFTYIADKITQKYIHATNSMLNTIDWTSATLTSINNNELQTAITPWTLAKST